MLRDMISAYTYQTSSIEDVVVDRRLAVDNETKSLLLLLSDSFLLKTLDSHI